MLFDHLPIDVIGKMVDSLIIHPFTILNTRSGEWQSRKKLWASYGIKGELGRNATDAVGDLFKTFNEYDKGKRVESTTSIFDPVLCELLYTWMVPDNGMIIDPFAGGSVRGIMAHVLNKRYWGCDLAKKQIKENKKQAKLLRKKDIINKMPKWVNGDSLDEMKNAPKADFIFTCPPYADLEKYSEINGDLSNMSHDKFSVAYNQIIQESCNRLRNNRFACVVISNIRNKDGVYFDLVGETVKGFTNAGLDYYNELILINPVGSLPIRIKKQFNTSRKFGRCHQTVLIFVKGDAKKATSILQKGIK